MEIFVSISLFILIIFSSTAHSKQRDFIAAVFEHRYRDNDKVQTPREIIQTNLEYYKVAAKLAAKKGTDILVFNEYGLHFNYLSRNILRPFLEYVPDPEVYRHNPCVEKELFKDRPILSTMSCLARDNQMYIVGNLGNIQPCENDKDCPVDGVLMYNTDVAFDREGYLVARYYKSNPYFELYNRFEEPKYITFETEFGTFGLRICFDLNWVGSVNLVERGIDTLAYPTYWYDDIAPLNAVEFQQAFALENSVNVLAANGQTPGNSTLGSGIYSKDRGALIYTYEPDGESKLLVAKISKNEPSDAEMFVVRENDVFPKKETGDKFPRYCYDRLLGLPNDMRADLRCYKSQTENHKLVKLHRPKGKVEACDNGFCCSLEYVAEDMKEDYYLAVRNFTNDVEGFYNWREETCLLVRCDPFEGKECVLWPTSSRTVFKSLEMRAQFTADRVYPTVSKSKNRLAPKSEWSYDCNEKETILKFQSHSRDPLLKVGFYGKLYSHDPPYIPWI